MVIFSFNYAKNTLGLKVDIVLWNPSQSLSLKKIVAEKLNTLMTMQTFLSPSVQYTEFSSLSRNGRGRYARKIMNRDWSSSSWRHLEYVAIIVSFTKRTSYILIEFWVPRLQNQTLHWKIKEQDCVYASTHPVKYKKWILHHYQLDEKMITLKKHQNNGGKITNHKNRCFAKKLMTLKTSS